MYMCKLIKDRDYMISITEVCTQQAPVRTNQPAGRGLELLNNSCCPFGSV